MILALLSKQVGNANLRSLQSKNILSKPIQKESTDEKHGAK